MIKKYESPMQVLLTMNANLTHHHIYIGKANRRELQGSKFGSNQRMGRKH